jgi:hypothetical protein
MIGKVMLGTLCAGLTLLVALRSDDEVIQASAAVASSSIMGFTATSVLLDLSKKRKSREVNADVYIEFLRQMNRQQALVEQQTPATCRGCSHYHGRVYGGHLFVCGMHPYGAESNYCDDWEQEN